MSHRYTRLASILLVALLAAVVPFAAPVHAAGTLTVNSTGDQSDAAPGNGLCETSTSTCTLRAAIQEANASAAGTTINFNIPTSDGQYAAALGVWSIYPSYSGLPELTVNNTVIDATTQPNGRASGPKIEINGGVFDASRNGITISSSGNTIKGFVINNYRDPDFGINVGYGIYLKTDGADSNTIESNWIGLAADGSTAASNVGAGIYIRGGDNNTIRNNVLSANGTPTNGGSANIILGITVDDSTVVTNGNIVTGNLIGTTSTGAAIVSGGNPQAGVRLGFYTTNTRVGGTTAAERNIISGHGNNIAVNAAGVYVDGVGQASNVIRGNYIGTNSAGTGVLANRFGVMLIDGVNGTTVSNNIISGNLDNGINAAQGLRSTSNLLIQGNRIGVDATGAPMGNGANGIAFTRNGSGSVGVTASTIQGNVISANSQDGILIGSAGLAGSFFANNIVTGNMIGTATDGASTSTNLLNGRYAIEIVSGTGNRIGGTTAAERNIIAAKPNFAGIRLDGANVGGTVVQGNYVGVAANGSSALISTPASRPSFGILVTGGSSGNQIGTAGNGNVIAANDTGIQVNASNGNSILGNTIGVLTTGNTQFGVWVFQSSNTVVGGTAAGQANSFSANGRNAVFVQNSSPGTTIVGNTVSASGQAQILLSGSGANGTVIDSNNVVNGLANGIVVDTATGVLITKTTTARNTGSGIVLANNGNNNRAAPTLNATLVTGSTGKPAVTGSVSGCGANCVVEIFSSATADDGEGPRYLASGTADPSTGAFTIEIPGCDRYLSATARDASSNTSPFSTPMVDTTSGCTAAAPTLSAGSPSSTANAPVSGNPGATVVFQHTLTNSGGLPGTFTISASAAPQGWAVSLDKTSVSLNAGQSTQIQVTVTIPANPRGGPPAEAVTVQASVNSVTATRVDYVQAPQTFGVDLSPLNVQFATSAAIPPLDFVHTVTNTGNGFDTISLAAVNATIAGSPVFSFPNGNQCANLAAGASCQITVRVQLPANSAGGSFDVTASAGGSVSKTVRDVAFTQSSIPDVSVFQRRDAYPDDVVTFQHVITNIGTQSGSFTVSLSQPNPLDGWLYSLSPVGPFTLAPNETQTVTVQVTVPGINANGAIAGTIKTATLNVVADSGATASAADAVRVLLKPQFTLGDATTPAQGFPLSTVSFTHALQNTSNGDDQFQITVTPTSGLENVVVTPASPVSVARGQTVNVVVTARIKAGTQASTGLEHLTVTANSVNTPDPGQQTKTDVVDVLGATVPQLSVSPPSQSTTPNATLNFNYTLTNIGNQTGTFDAPTFTLPTATAGWNAAVVNPPACLSAALAPNATCDFVVAVTAPAGALAGTNVVKTTVTSATTPQAQAATATTQVVVTAVPALTLAPDQSASTDPNTPVDYQHLLTNTGNVTSTFTFSVQAPAGWTASTPASVTNLAPGQSVQVTTTVTPPQIAASGTQGVVTLTARSSVAPNPTAGVVDTTTINAVDGAELTPSQQTVHGSAGQVVYFYPKLRNTGSTAIGYDLNISSAAWTAIVTPTQTPVLQPGATTALTISVAIPAGTPADVDNLVTLNVHKQGDTGAPLATGSYTATTALLGALLTPATNTGTVLPGATRVYTHTLRNIGSIADTFQLNAISISGWKVSAEPATVFLDPGQAREVQVTVTVPPGLAVGVQDYSYLEVQALSTPRLNARGTEITTVGLLVDAILSPVKSAQVDPGDTVNFTHRLYNGGNADDTFTIAVTSERGWPVSLVVPPAGMVTIPPNGNFPVQVRVNVPDDVLPGQFDRITIRATSTNNPNLSVSIVDTAFYPPEQQTFTQYEVWLPLVVR